MYLGLPKSAPTDLISKKIEELCMKAVNGLESSGLMTKDEVCCIQSTEAGRLLSIYYLDLETMKRIMKDEVCCIQSTEAGRLLSIYYLDLETMKRIMKIKGDESLEQLLWVVCESHELSDMHLRVDERRCLNALNRNNTAATIRFPMKGKINTRQMKLNCIIQAVLGCLPIHEPSLNQEAITIMRIAVRICKCLVSYVTRPNALRTSSQNYQAILNAIVLAKCMESQLWENSKYVSKQLKGIGPTYSTLLASAGKINFMLLEESHPRDLERIMNKGPPAGNVLRKQISLLPKYQLTITPIDENSIKIQLKLLNQIYLAESLDQLTAGTNHKSYLIIGDSENYLLILASFKDKDLITFHNGEITYQTVRRHQFEHKIMAHCISSNFAGIDVHCEYLFQELDFGSKDIIPISPIEKTDRKNIKQTAITDTFKIRKRKNHDPVDTNVVEKKKCDFAIIEQIKSFTQSHNKLRNVIESKNNKDIDNFHDLQQNCFDVDLDNDDQVFTNLNEINIEKDDEQINEILNVIDNEILQQDRPNFNIPQNQVPVVSDTGGNKTYDSEVRTTKTRIRCFNETMEKEKNNFNVIDRVQNKAFFTNFSGSNKEEDDEQINEILNKIDKEILQQDKPKYDITEKQVPVISNPYSIMNVGKKTNNSEVKTTKTKTGYFNKTIQKEKNNFNVIDEIQKKANNMTETENRDTDEQSTFVNTVKNHIDEYLEKAKQSSKVAEKQILQLVEISPNKTITKSFCKKKTDAKQNIVTSDKGLSETNDQKNVYLTDKNIDDTLKDNENENTVSIYENKENIEEFKLPQIQKEDLDYAIASEISNVNKTNSVISLRKNKPSLNHYVVNELESRNFKEGYSNYTNNRSIWNTSDIGKTNQIPNHENERNISKDFFALEELQNEHENDRISNAVTNIYSKDHEVLDHENKPSNNNSIDYDHLKNSEKTKTISQLENVKHNTTKDCILQKLKEIDDYKDVRNNNKDVHTNCVNPDQFNNNESMEIDYSNDYDESNKALVPILSSNAANNVYENCKLSPNSTLEQAAEKMEEKEMLPDSKKYGSSSPSVIKNNISFQPYFNKVLDNTVSFGCEYMKKFSFTKTQVNVCTKSNTEANYCIISKVQIDLDIIKNQSTIEKGNFKPIEEKLPNVLEDNKLNGDQNNLENSKINIEETRCKNDIVKREQTNNINNNQDGLSTIQSKFKESPQTSIELKEQCEKTYMEQYYSVPKTCHTVKDIINKYQKLASRIKDLDKHYKPKTQNTNIQPPPELDHSKLMAKIFESIKDSTETNKHELEVNKLIDEPDIEYTRNKNFNDLESPDLGSPDLESTDLESPIIDDESPSFEKTDLLNNDLDISQSMLNPKSLLESLAQNDITLPPLQFRDEAKRNSPVFDIDLNDFNLTNVDKINLDDAFEKDDNTSSTASEIETWTMSKDDETWSNISKPTTAEMDGGVVHPQSGGMHPGVPGVLHGMPMHGAGPDGEHVPHGPRRRFQNRPKQPNNLERLPLDEAAKREMEALPMKTPVSVLQELLARRGTVPKYELVQIEGMIHEPTFRYRVTVADLVAMGTGRSKKEAKHSAAKALLDRLTGAAPAEPPTNGNVPEPGAVVSLFEDKLMGNPVGWLYTLLTAMGTGRSKKEAKHSAAKALLDRLTGAAPAEPPTNGNVPEPGAVVSLFEDKLMGNPVGWLQELCMSRFWPPPSYHAENDDNVNRRLPHERQFTIVCTLLKRREVGTGKSKKLAKRQAAYKMWQALKDNPPESFQNEEEGVASRYADLKDSKISTLTTSHSHKVSQFHKHLKQSIGPNLAKLQVTPLNNKDFNFVQFLQEIASEQAFEVTYVDIEEKSMTGRSQCLVQLSTLPVAVCYGSGLTSKDAQSSAAQNALEYLKIMTKK
ncbi:putative ATP-dependent DNA helicase HFM1 [Papilio machaon]|uniref:Putative ATP-dependent DNA helicase HFM1 n=1 Tax=Papilio machaon TaxID=76193 RepID=A0A194RCD3_PAPMA|nr:putative ATP-dependent DNA helicase HFM1 [Papilio machaon]